MIRKSLGNHLAELPFDLDVDLRHEIDGALLVDSDVAAEMCHLHITRVQNRFDGGREELGWERISHQRTAS